MIRSADELIADVTAFIGEVPTDEAITLLENVTDTVNSYRDLQERFDTLDATWRKRYTDRFMGKTEEKEETEETEETEEKDNAEEITIEDLFEEREDD